MNIEMGLQRGKAKTVYCLIEGSSASVTTRSDESSNSVQLDVWTQTMGVWTISTKWTGQESRITQESLHPFSTLLEDLHSEIVDDVEIKDAMVRLGIETDSEYMFSPTFFISAIRRLIATMVNTEMGKMLSQIAVSASASPEGEPCQKV